MALESVRLFVGKVILKKTPSNIIRWCFSLSIFGKKNAGLLGEL
jgi:hypothetical protein